MRYAARCQFSQIAVANSCRSLAGSLRQREITGFPVACRRTSSRACWSAQPAGPVPADETPHPARGHIQAEPVVGPAQRVPQMLGLGRGDRQRLPLRPPVTEVEGVLGARAAAAGPPPSTPPPPPASVQPDVLNLAGTTPVRVHDLHRGRPTRGLHRPHIGRPDRLKTSEQYKRLFGQY